MTDKFARLAERLAGIVPLTLGWRPGDFWDATPAELTTIFTPLTENAEPSLSRDELTALMERDAHG